MKLGMKVAGAIVAILLATWLACEAFGLLSAKSDFAVICGIAILLVLLIIVFGVGKKIITTIRRSAEMKNKIGMMMLLVAVVTLSMMNSGCTNVKPGHVGIKISNYGESRGVNDLPLSTGVVFYMPGASSVFDYPTFVQTATWTRNPNEGKKGVNEEIAFNTSEGTNLTCDISLSYHLEDKKVPHFYVQFRSDDLETFTDGFLHNVARDAFNEIAAKYTLEQLYGQKKEEFLAEVRKRVNENVNKYGVVIDQFGFIGTPRMDPSIMTALNNKLRAVQDAIAAENNKRTAIANAQIAIETARGTAAGNELLAKSITPQLIQWRNMDITEKAVAKWNGQRPTVEGSSSGLLLNIPIK